MARTCFLHPGGRREHRRGIEILPLGTALRGLEQILGVRTGHPEPKKRKAKKRAS